MKEINEITYIIRYYDYSTHHELFLVRYKANICPIIPNKNDYIDFNNITGIVKHISHIYHYGVGCIPIENHLIKIYVEQC